MKTSSAGIDLLDVEVTELGPDPLPEMLVRIPAAVLHASRCHVLGISIGEEHLLGAGKQRFARAFLRKRGFGSGRETSLALPSEARDREVVLP
ncbi:MAG: hypothetical protein M3O46_01170 [Myxococcota bacterium]|nr:hypothetical protein [Myxococcota bacterium]